jgi:pimeloyl-ACP methyl ester carboxylesterase
MPAEPAEGAKPAEAAEAAMSAMSAEAAGEPGPVPPAQGHVPPHEALPLLLVPGLLTSPRLYAGQLPALWRYGPVMVADNTGGDTIAEVASGILAAAPPMFALAGLSMGGYISLEIMRQAPGRVTRLALLDTSARPDTPAQRERRQRQIAKTRDGHFDEIPGELWPLLVHPASLGSAPLWEIVRQMAGETGPEAFVRQQLAIMSRPDSRPYLGAITCPALVLVGDSDALTPPELSAELAAGIPGARLVTVPGCGHLSALEQPALVTEALEGWLRASAARP